MDLAQGGLIFLPSQHLTDEPRKFGIGESSTEIAPLDRHI